MSDEHMVAAGYERISAAADASHQTSQSTDDSLSAVLDVRFPWLGPCIIGIFVLAAYFVTPSISPLLDEQFWLKWTAAAGGTTAPLGDYLMWYGFSPADMLGPVASIFNKLSFLLSFGAVPLLRIEGMILHAVAGTLLYLSCRRLWRAAGANSIGPLVAAVIFAIYPINAEAVSWFGGRGIELCGALFLASLYCYLRGRRAGEIASVGGNLQVVSSAYGGRAADQQSALGFKWPWMISSLGLYTLSLLSSASVWTGCILFIVVELWLFVVVSRNHTGSATPVPGGRQPGDDPTERLLGPLALCVVTAAYIAGMGIIWQMTSYEIRPDLSFGAIGKTLRALFFPINEAIWHKYARQYDILYLLLPPFALLLIWALKANRPIRQLFTFSALWFLLAVFPEIGHIAKENLYGSRLFYLASMPLALILSLAFTSLANLVPGGSKLRRTACGIVSTIATAVLCVFFLAHITNQNMAYRNGGREIAAIQKSMSVVEAHTNAPFLLVNEVPKWTTVAPVFAGDGLQVFDGQTHLISASTVSPGLLKDALRDGKYRDAALNWVEPLRSLMPLDISLFDKPFQKMDARQIAMRFVPGIEFIKTAHLDVASNVLQLQSNNERGPVMRLSAAGMSPVTDDFLYVDARIDAPHSREKPLIELYWQTGTHTDYNNNTRRVWTKAVVGDGNYHRYYLSLRSLGWIDSGPLFAITLGFPAGSQVAIKEIGIADKGEVIPNFNGVVQNSEPRAARVTAPYYNFPNAPDLGLFDCGNSDSITVTHDTSRIPDATGVLVEISMPDRIFPNPNGNEPSGVGGKKVAINGVKGTYAISTTDFPRSGVYSLRAIAIDKGHNPLGNFSDAIYCLVRRPRSNGWAEQLQ